MSLLTNWWRLPPRRKRLVLDAFAQTLVVRALLGIGGAASLKSKVAPAAGVVDVSETAWAVAVVGRHTPGSSCLVQALAMQRMLARRGKRGQVQIGVSRSDHQLEAHAWLICEGEVVLGASEAGEFRVIGTI